MKATGIVRRIDDLGRVVIPKEIRRTMHIREGDPLEIYTDREGEVIFKKYSPMGELSSFAAQYAETLHKTCDLAVVICDRDSVIAAAGVPKKDYNDKPLSNELSEIIEKRSFFASKSGEAPVPVFDEENSPAVGCVMPIITAGDISGAVVSVRTAGGASQSVPNPDIESKLVTAAAHFLGRQIEG